MWDLKQTNKKNIYIYIYIYKLIGKIRFVVIRGVWGQKSDEESQKEQEK